MGTNEYHAIQSAHGWGQHKQDQQFNCSQVDFAELTETENRNWNTENTAGLQRSHPHL